MGLDINIAGGTIWGKNLDPDNEPRSCFFFWPTSTCLLMASPTIWSNGTLSSNWYAKYTQKPAFFRPPGVLVLRETGSRPRRLIVASSFMITWDLVAEKTRLKWLFKHHGENVSKGPKRFKKSKKVPKGPPKHLPLSCCYLFLYHINHVQSSHLVAFRW